MQRFGWTIPCWQHEDLASGVSLRDITDPERRGSAPARPSCQALYSPSYLEVGHTPSLIVRPHPQHFDCPTFWNDLVHEPVLYIDTPRVGAG